MISSVSVAQKRGDNAPPNNERIQNTGGMLDTQARKPYNMNMFMFMRLGFRIGLGSTGLVMTRDRVPLGK
jgi:hypothetical protein